MNRALLLSSLAILTLCVGCASGLADQVIQESIDMRSRIQKLEAELQQLSMLLPEQNEGIQHAYAMLNDAKLNMQTIGGADDRLRVVMSDPLAKVEEAIRELEEMARGGRQMSMHVATARGQTNDLIYSTQRIQNTGQQIKDQSDIVKNVVGLLGIPTGGGSSSPQPTVQAAPPDSSESTAGSGGSLWPWLLGGAGGALVAGGAFGYRQVRTRTRPQPTPAGGMAADPATNWTPPPTASVPSAAAPQPWTPPPPSPPPNTGWAPPAGYAAGYPPQQQAGFGVQATLPGFSAGVWNGPAPTPARPGPWPHNPVAANYGVNGQGGAVAPASPFRQRPVAIPGA